MAAAVPLILRERVIDVVATGTSCCQAAERFGVVKPRKPPKPLSSSNHP